jgi:hypothetical protein
LSVPPSDVNRMPADEIRERMTGVISRGRMPSWLTLVQMMSVSRSLVRSVPPWVGQLGEFHAGGRHCLLVEPKWSSDETFPSQIVLDVPPGRYMVDTLDVRTASWCSRESAAGGPLVAGLPFVGGPVLVVVTRTGQAGSGVPADSDEPQ